MADTYRLGSPGGVTVVVDSSALTATIVFWALVTAALLLIFGFEMYAAAVWAVAIVALHWAVLLVHHVGHAAAARLSGYPMQGLVLHGLLGRDRYPLDEPELPARVHAQRALGGPIASLALGAALAALTWSLPPVNLPLRLALGFAAVESLLVLGVGVFVPLGFTDGTTLLNLWRTGAP